MKNQNDPTGLLEQAEQHWRQEVAPVPAGLVESTIARVHAGAASNHRRPDRAWWHRGLVRGSVVAAGVALLISAVLLWTVAGHGRMALGEVLEQARAAKAVRFTLWHAPDGDPGSKRTRMYRVIVVPPDWLLVDSESMRVRINKKLNKQLVMNPANKSALVLGGALDGAGANQAASLFEDICQLNAADGKALEETVLEGRKVQRFSLQRMVQGQPLPVELWADTQTRHIVLVKMKSPSKASDPRSGPDPHLYFTDFDWNPSVVPADLSCMPPKGYLLRHDGPADENDAVEMLRQFVDLAGGGGDFPPALTRDAYLAVLRNRAAQLQSVPQPETRRATGLALKIGSQPAMEVSEVVSSDAMIDFGNQQLAIERGFEFVINDDASGNWHYAPEGAKVGEKGKPVLWYQPVGRIDYRVIDSDFSVHDRKASELPKTPPLKTDWPKPVRGTGTFIFESTPRPSTMP